MNKEMWKLRYFYNKKTMGMVVSLQLYTFVYN